MTERVLVVDDDKALVELVSDTLLDAGYVVSGVGTAEECLASLAGERPDLLILDITLPGMSGLEALASIRNEAGTKYLPVIILTASNQHDDRLVAWMGGADRYITKPFTTQALLHAVRHLLHPPARL